jgi:hypothetical protein
MLPRPSVPIMSERFLNYRCLNTFGCCMCVDEKLCMEMVTFLAARLAPDATGETFVKIKTLQLIIATLQCPPELRSETSKFRLCVMDQALDNIKLLTAYTCDPDPKFGDKPAEQVVRTMLTA